MSKSDKIKEIVKGGKPSFGTNPSDPWSAKANLAESEAAMLKKFLLSRGINPEFVSKDTKIAHSKSGEFMKWKSDHENVDESVSHEHTPTQKRLNVLKKATHVHKEIRVADGGKKLHSEEADEKDTITFDIPLLIRVLEYAREDVKSDIQLHKVVEKLIDIRNQGTLSMDDYETIVKEEVESLDEISKQTLTGYVHSAISDRNKIDDRRMALNTKQATQMRKQGSISLRRHKNITNLLAKSDKRSAGIDKALKRLTKEDASEGDEILARHSHHHAEMMKAMKSGDKAGFEHHSTELNKAKMDYAKHSARVSANKPEDAIAKDYKDQEKIRGIGHVRDHVEVDGTVVENRVVDTVKKAWKAVSNFDDPSPKYDGQTRRRAALKKKLIDNKKKVSEAKEANYGGDYQASVQALKAKAEKKPVDMASLAARMQASYKKDKPVKEDAYQDSQAATQTSFDMGNSPAEAPNTPRFSNKTTKIINIFNKKKVVKEELYDQEKDNKPVQTNGKKPTVSKQVDEFGDDSSKAAIVMQGGKTLTGEPRDTIEIDPMVRKPKGGDVNAPESDGKSDKKDKQ